ncbi:MAG: caspase family protein [Ferruginibacter sp.]
MIKKLCASAPSQPFKKGLAGKLLFFLFALVSVHGYSQSYFYFENKLINHSGQPVNYFTFLTLQADGSATARIHYLDSASGEDKLIEQKFIDSSGPVSDSSNPEKKYLMPSGDPYYVMGTDDSSFVMPTFVFQKQGDSLGAFYDPVSMGYKGAGEKWSTAEMIKQQQKSYSELTNEKELVSHFFNKKDQFYDYLYTLNTRALSNLERKTRLFLVAVANVTDPKIGVTSKKDLVKVTETFTTMAAQLGITIVVQNLSGNKFSKSQVENAINRLKPAAIDIVVFYYSGHGFRYSNDTSKYPRISFRTNPDQDIDKLNLSVEDIYKRILKKGARVNIVLSDCCNDDIGAPVPVGKDLLRTKSPGTEGIKINIDNCKALFFPGHPISVFSSAAEINQLATGNPALGGFFTNFFQAQLINSLYTNQGESSWLRILINAKENARKQALTALCGNGRCVQRAEISVIPPL